MEQIRKGIMKRSSSTFYIITLFILLTAVGCSLEVTPKAVTIECGESQQFIADVKGVRDKTVSWYVDGSPEKGTITQQGLYTAPDILPPNPLALVQVCSLVNTNLRDAAQIYLIDESPDPGELGGPCYGNGTCDSGLDCVDDICEEGDDEGKLGGPCYPNVTCDSGLDCVDGICEEEIITTTTTTTAESLDKRCYSDNIDTYVNCEADLLRCYALTQDPIGECIPIIIYCFEDYADDIRNCTVGDSCLAEYASCIDRQVMSSYGFTFESLLQCSDAVSVCAEWHDAQCERECYYKGTSDVWAPCMNDLEPSGCADEYSACLHDCVE